MTSTDVLYVSDLDGTLLNSAGTLSSRASVDLAHLLRNGMQFTIATARSWTTTQRAIAGLPITLPIILHNGAVTFEPVSRSVSAAIAFTPGNIESLLKLLRSQELSPLVSSVEGGSELVSYLRGTADQGVLHFWNARPNDPRRSPRRDWAALPRDDVVGVSTIGTGSQVQRLGETLAPLAATRGWDVRIRADTYHPEWSWLEIAPPRSSKGEAVVALARRLGARRLIVFGDHSNDIGMFAVADESYAVSNATPELRSLATGVIGSHDDDGVVAWLHANVNGF